MYALSKKNILILLRKKTSLREMAWILETSKEEVLSAMDKWGLKHPTKSFANGIKPISREYVEKKIKNSKLPPSQKEQALMIFEWNHYAADRYVDFALGIEIQTYKAPRKPRHDAAMFATSWQHRNTYYGY